MTVLQCFQLVHSSDWFMVHGFFGRGSWFIWPWVVADLVDLVHGFFLANSVIKTQIFHLLSSSSFSLSFFFPFFFFLISGFVFLDMSLCSCCSCLRHI